MQRMYSAETQQDFEPRILRLPEVHGDGPQDPTPGPGGGGGEVLPAKQAATTRLTIHCPQGPQPVAAGLDIWACWPPFDEDANPAAAQCCASDLEMTAAKQRIDSLATHPGEYAGASEFRAFDGSGNLRLRRPVAA